LPFRLSIWIPSLGEVERTMKRRNATATPTGKDFSLPPALCQAVWHMDLERVGGSPAPPVLGPVRRGSGVHRCYT
jgi:hypothetical protein